MKRIYNFVILSVWAMLSVCCSSEEPIQVPVKVGEEVKFGLSLEGTRTVYGSETTADGRTYFPIYWSEGDKVQIYSPDCPEGRNKAEYSVKPVAGQSYAESLTKTGSYGVQWGENATAKFYSVYPSANSTFAKVNGNVTATLNITSSQTANYIFTNGVYNVADMNNVVMYAQTEAINSGNEVNLQYNPFSTVLDFEIEATVGTEASALVQSIKLEAKEDITGKFTLTFNDAGEPTVAKAGDNGNVIDMNFGVKPELKSGANMMRVKMNLMPVNFANINDWKVTLTLLEGGEEITFAKTLSSASKVVAGKIHKVKLPKISINKKWEYKPDMWMQQLPEYKTIYLSELSIPGAWYAGGKGYQSQTDPDTPQPIADLWNAGVRAFGIECRSTCPSRLSDNNMYVGVSGTGSKALTNNRYVSANRLSDIIKDVANKVSNSNEFALIVVNYAYGGSGGYRDTDYKFFLNGVQSAITSSGASNVLSNITKETTISDVINNVIVKINVDSRVSYAASGVNAMFSVAPLAQDLSNDKVYFSDLSYGSWTAGKNSYTDNPTITADSYLWCFSSANRTQLDTGTATNIPSYSQRKAQLNAMMEHSRQIYDSSTHNVWFYFNCGGTETTSLTADTDADNAKAFAGVMNPWLKKIIDLKTYGGTKEVVNEDGSTSSFIVSSDPSPLGIVMFNYCTDETYQGPAIIKSIIEMNNKSGLKHATPKTKGAYDGTVNNGGNAITTK